ncbi:unnamed protein product [Brassicogethes aeneus]|uniref:Uncharacterized protein n=1 Tax=Brassicogethes aeneus TaxID=1431903 RepID=A0A9P0FDN5_BRAAE|nr:unnamed protein product [Brassicogethes aeneus]
MKFSLVFVAVAIVAVQAGKLTDEQKQKLASYYKDCKESSGVEQISIDDAKAGKYREDPKAKAFFYCVSKKMGLQNEAGEIQKDVFLMKVTNFLENEEEAKAIVEKCNKQEATPEQTTYSLMKCCYENSKEHVNSKPIKEVNTIPSFNKKCKEDSGVDQTLIDKAKEGIFSDEIKFKSFVYCVSKKVGLQNITGEIEKLIAIENLIEILGDKDLAADLTKKCAKHRSSPEETAYQTFKCIYEKNPKHKVVFIE